MPTYTITVYEWSLYTVPAALSTANIETDTDVNDPALAEYDAGSPTWLGETFTFNGGAATVLSIDDDDPDFEDAYVETGGVQTLASSVTIGGTTYPAGTSVQNEFSMLDAGGNEVWVVRIDGTNVGLAYPSGARPTAGDDFTAASGRDGDPVDSADGLSSTQAYSGMICFLPGVRIATPAGPRLVEDLRAGDLVTTRDAGAQPVLWTSCRRVVFGPDDDDARPVQIKSGALSPGLPRRDLAVSPQHRILMTRADGTEVFVAAKSLTGRPGVRVMRGKRFADYCHFALKRHAVVVADGVPSESCYLGSYMLSAASPAMRRELQRLFPAVAQNPEDGYGPLAREEVRVREARRMLDAGALEFCEPLPPVIPRPTVHVDARARYLH